jgi:hypothetical protein
MRRREEVRASFFGGMFMGCVFRHIVRRWLTAGDYASAENNLQDEWPAPGSVRHKAGTPEPPFSQLTDDASRRPLRVQDLHYR